MPINAGPEYYLAEEKYLKAKTKEEKILALEEMIRELPKHKGTEKLLAQLKRKLAKLKTQEGKRKKFVGERIEKTGDAQICIVGETNSGKSSLLKELTGKNVEISEKRYTTTKPEIAVLDYGGAKLQLIEIPSTFENIYTSLLSTCDLILALYTNTKEKETLSNLLERKKVLSKTIFVLSKSDLSNKKTNLFVSTKTKKGLENLKKTIWDKLKLIRVYTKTNNKIEKIPVVLKEGSTVKDLALEIHKDFFENFKFARISDNTNFIKKVGLKYKLKEGDIVEIHSS
ncbi:MAG: TGS domain-containing protein [Candidatus Aenigmarchaeota archaeon]|nr:TGS domain-containing protein [Candidatus Aenigmarchaeota archaeon]